MQFTDRLKYIIGLISLLLLGCGTHSLPVQQPSAVKLENEPLTAPATLPSDTLGTVTVVNKLHNFVLLNMTSHLPIASGTVLVSVSGTKKTALLRVAGPSRRPFLIADIVEGQPSSGEQVALVAHPNELGVKRIN